MSKSIIVIDTPEKCSECPCFNSDEFDTYCALTDKRLEYDFNYEYTKPDWCSLKEFPEKIQLKGIITDSGCNTDYEDGWNSCIDHIIGL